MAAQEDPPQLLNYKTWVLKVSIHCEGCKRKVKKILQQVPGVYAIDIDLKQQKVTVTGDVEAEALLRKLHKSGKHAELVPQQQSDHKEKKPAKIKNKEKQIDPQSKETAPSTSQPDSTAHKDGKSVAKVVIPKEPPVKVQHANDEVPKSSEKTSNGFKPEGETGTDSVDEQAVAKEKSDETVKESKSEGKKPETESAGKQQIPVAAEKKVADSDDNASASGEKSGGGPVGEPSGSTGKKKKKKGQNSNNTEGTPSLIVTPAGSEFEHNNMGPQVPAPTNDIPPRQPSYHYYPQQGPQIYAPPPAYVVSYNTAPSTSSYTASYYAQAPPTSYAYTYSVPGPVVQPPPSDVDTYPHQPLDSFEMFSDENPNGCFIM